MTAAGEVIMEFTPVLIIVLIAVLVIVAAIYGTIAARKRREEMSALAARLNLAFNPSQDSLLAQRFGFLNKLAQGANRYAFNILSGPYRGQEVLIFNYHYETYSSNSKGGTQTHHHYFSFFILNLPASFPELTIAMKACSRKSRRHSGMTILILNPPSFRGAFACGRRTKNSLTTCAIRKSSSFCWAIRI